MADNFFDSDKPARIRNEPWADDPPPADEGDYGDVRAFPTGERVPVDAPPTIWHSSRAWKEADIPRRPWIVPGYIMRGSVTVIAGAGSAGKSSLLKAWGIAMTQGLTFNRFMPPEQFRAMSYNVEDDLNEEWRRLSATLRQFNATPEDLEDMLHIIGPAHVGTLIHYDRASGYIHHTAVLEAIEAKVIEERIDVLFLDPLVELHDAEENDNTSLRAVMAALRQLAIRCNIAVVVAHHTRKGAVTPGDPDAVRGGGSIVGAARVVYTVCSMSDEEAAKIGIPSARRRFYFRIDSAKSNYAPLDGAEWFERRPYEIGNGEEIAAAEPWTPPSPWDGITWPMIDTILEAVEAGPSPGEYFAASRQAKSRWVGNLIAEVTRRGPEQITPIIKAWLDSGVLQTGQYASPAARGGMTGCIRVDLAKVAELRREFEGSQR
jgi:hypothetical protein